MHIWEVRTCLKAEQFRERLLYIVHLDNMHTQICVIISFLTVVKQFWKWDFCKHNFFYWLKSLWWIHSWWIRVWPDVLYLDSHCASTCLGRDHCLFFSICNFLYLRVFSDVIVIRVFEGYVVIHFHFFLNFLISLLWVTYKIVVIPCKLMVGTRATTQLVAASDCCSSLWSKEDRARLPGTEPVISELIICIFASWLREEMRACETAEEATCNTTPRRRKDRWWRFKIMDW